MTFNLYYRSVLIGEITNTNNDFPGFNGLFNLLLKPTDVIYPQIIEYIKFSTEMTELYFQTSKIDKNRENILLEKESLYENFINSNEWKIVNLKGEETKILVPTFDKEGIVNYRLNI